MSNEIIYCKKCHIKKREMSYENACKTLEQNSGYKVVDKCTSSCGLGKKNYFAEIDEDLLVGENFEELLKEIEEY